MKRLITIALIISTLFVCAACQPTPSAPIVQSKNDGKLQQLISSNPAPAGKYKAEDSWIESIEGLDDTLHISIDAQVHIPDAEMYPIYRVYPDEIKQDEADRFFEFFLGDEKTYNPDSVYVRTKAVIQDEILSLEKQLSDPDSQLNRDAKQIMSEDEWNDYVSSVRQQIKNLHNEYKSAPSDSVPEETSRTFVKYNARSDEYTPFYMYKAGGVTVEDNAADKYAFVYKDADGRMLYQDMQYSRYGAFRNYKYGAVFNKTDNLNFCTLSYDEAKKYADDCLQGSGYEDYKLDTVFSTIVRSETAKLSDDTPQSEMPQGYVFTYTPQTDGVPMIFYRLKPEVYQNIESKSVDSGYWNPPCIQITVDNKGVCMFNKISDFKLDRKLNENIPLLGFETIKDIFRKYIVMETDFAQTLLNEDMYESPVSRDITITDIRLGYMFVKEMNSDAYMTMPVFMFFGNEVMTYKSQEYSPFMLDEKNQYRDTSFEVGHSYLTINAVDGSIIDMSLGY